MYALVLAYFELRVFDGVKLSFNTITTLKNVKYFNDLYS